MIDTLRDVMKSDKTLEAMVKQEARATYAQEKRATEETMHKQFQKMNDTRKQMNNDHGPREMLNKGKSTKKILPSHHGHGRSTRAQEKADKEKQVHDVMAATQGRRASLDVSLAAGSARPSLDGASSAD